MSQEAVVLARFVPKMDIKVPGAMVGLEKLAPFMQGERRFYNLDVLEDESP